LSENPHDAFGITKEAGIVFIKNASIFHSALEAEMRLVVSWAVKKSASIKIHLKNSPTGQSCEANPHEFCNQHRDKQDCQTTCAIGSLGGVCVFRETEHSSKILSLNYTACSPDLTYCPDRVCDPLEKLAHSLKINICPLDCADRHQVIFGMAGDTHGVRSANGPCHCTHEGKCICGNNGPKDGLLRRPSKPTTTSSTEVPTSIDSNEILVTIPTSSAILDLNIQSRNTTTHHKQDVCGLYCIGLVTGLPMLIACFIIYAILSKRCTSGKKDIYENANAFSMRTISSDTEVLHVDIPVNRMAEHLKLDLESKWEFDRSQLQLDFTLGEGEFGKVVKGYATNIADQKGVTTVAVKMLKTGANSVELLALLSEFQLLQEVNHPNVIRLLGACTKGENPLLIIEYCEYGSLRNYLRMSRKLEVSHVSDYENNIEPISVKDVLSFAWQISKGMAYLTEIKLVHRDLAARNVLLAEGKICKISDFGLTRDVYEDDAYLKKSKDRVPVKWMAPESLADHVYTTKSDVWAFGILAWELITLGASPYPG
jgi:proto-oncogene tyrosine-protein kinase Ret